MNALETRLQGRVDRREMIQKQWDDLVAERGDGELSDTDKKQIEMYRSETVDLDEEIAKLTDDRDARARAEEASKSIRRAMLGSVEGVDQDGDGVVYRTMAAYARDVILTRQSGGEGACAKIQAQFGSPDAIQSAAERLQLVKRVSNTLSSNVGGLQPPEHIAQIFQVIDRSRPLVAAATRTTLERGRLTYPKISQRPVVAVQNSQKTEAGSQAMHVDMETADASTYLGGGDLSWQAINWSTPDALQLWFDLAAADYALKTESDAATVLQSSAFTYAIDSPIGATPAFEDFMTAVGDGYSAVFENSGRTANTVIVAPDRYGYLLGLTSDQFSQFVSVGGDNVGPLNILISRGLDSGVIAVGDMAALLVAETAGAPVELRVVEPAIGGVEVGIIGAFEAVVVDDGAFSLLTDAS